MLMHYIPEVKGIEEMGAIESNEELQEIKNEHIQPSSI